MAKYTKAELKKLKVGELKAIAKEHKDAPKKGSGKNGSVLKGDLVEFLEGKPKSEGGAKPPVAAAGGGDAKPPVAAGDGAKKDYSKMKITELRDEVKGKKGAPQKGDGSGKNGSVLKKDLVEFLTKFAAGDKPVVKPPVAAGDKPVVKPPAAAAKPPAAGGKKLNFTPAKLAKLKIAELRAHAKTHGIPHKGLGKADLINALLVDYDKGRCGFNDDNKCDDGKFCSIDSGNCEDSVKAGAYTITHKGRKMYGSKAALKIFAKRHGIKGKPVEAESVVADDSEDEDFEGEDAKLIAELRKCISLTVGGR